MEKIWIDRGEINWCRTKKIFLGREKKKIFYPPRDAKVKTRSVEFSKFSFSDFLAHVFDRANVGKRKNEIDVMSLDPGEKFNFWPETPIVWQ